MRCAQFIASLQLPLLFLSSCHGLFSDRYGLALFPRGSSPESHPFADPKGKGKAPAREEYDQSSGLLGDVLRQTLSRPTSQAHPSATTHTHTSHEAPAHSPHSSQTSQVHAAHPAHLSKSGQAIPSQATSAGRLSHLVAGLRPAGSYPRKIRSKATQMATAGVEKPGPKSTGPKKKGKGIWWKKPMSRPSAAPGTGKYYEAKKLYRAKKLERQRLSEEHPSAKHQPHQGEPGSPGPGTHAVSKRGTRSALFARGSGSTSSSPSSSKGKEPAHQDDSSGLLEDVVRQGQSKPATSHPTELLEDIVHQAKARGPSHVHSSQSLQEHPPAHQSSSMHSPPAHPKKAKDSTGPRPGHEEHGGRLGHIVAGLRPLRSLPRQATKQASQALRVSGAEPAQKPQSLSKLKWWQRPQSRPPAQYGTDKYYERRKQWREKQREKKLKSQELPAEHPSSHHKRPPGGPGSPGAASQALSKRRRARSGQ